MKKQDNLSLTKTIPKVSLTGKIVIYCLIFSKTIYRINLNNIVKKLILNHIDILYLLFILDVACFVLRSTNFLYICNTKIKGTIAQLVEQWTENPCVPGSIPGGTTKREKNIAFFSLFVYIEF